MKFYRNNKGGTNTVELGPALFIILIVVLIPCIDFMSIGLMYACGWYCNHEATREAACKGPLNAQAGATGATTAWQATGLGKFCKLQSPATSTVMGPNPYPPDIDGDGKNDYCKVQTTVQVNPMFPLPFGLPSAITFIYQDCRPYEEKDLN